MDIERMVEELKQTLTSNIIVDLGDIEPRSQEYPITISFIKKLNSNLEQIAKASWLHSNYVLRNVQLDAFLNLVTNVVFLRVNSRQFNKIDEKWTILTSCIETYNIFMSSYNPIEHGNAHQCSFRLMSQILQDSDLLKTVMMNIEDAIANLENDFISNSSFKPDPLLDDYINASLNLLNCIAEKQEDFFELIKHIPGYPTAINVKLAVLFNGVNPRTGAVDRLATLIRIPASTSEKAAYQALKLLNQVVEDNHSLAQQVYLHRASSDSPLLRGDNLVTLFANSLSSDSKQVRIATLKFISTCLEHKLGVGRDSYNIAHELLGFDKQMTTLREHGSTGKVFDCLHAIISFFENENFEHPELKEERSLGLEIIHKLCVDLRTCDLTLRFLRSSYDFLTKYLKNLFNQFNSDTITGVLDIRIDEVIWIMRLLSIEIKLSCERSMKSISTNHLNLLLSDKPRKLLELIPNSVCGHTHPPMPNWNCFDNDELWKIIAERADGTAVIDLKELHRKLTSEVKQIHVHLALAQKNLVKDEIAEILDFACSLNQSNRMQAKKYAYFNAWRELTETIICVNALECFESDLAARILFEITHELISKTEVRDFITGLFTLLSSTILVATSKLKKIGPQPVVTTNFLSTALSIQHQLEKILSLPQPEFNRARVNLYSSFLNASRALPEAVSSDLKFNRSLLERVYKDTLVGPEIVKVTALSILSQTDLSWVEDATRDGSLRHLIKSLSDDDQEIVASKGEIKTKAFFLFEYKVSLFKKIASCLSGAKCLIQLNIMDVLESLTLVDSYLLLLGTKTIFHRLFFEVIQLMLALSVNMRSCNKNLAKIRPLMHTEILKNVPLLKDRPDGLETLIAITSLQSQIILDADTRLKRDFVNSIQHFTNNLENEHMEILVNLLFGCIRILRSDQNNPAPIFAPSWNASSSSHLMAQPSLGTLVSILNNLHSQSHSPSDDHRETISEKCLDIIWFHMNIYLHPDYKTKQVRELESFKNDFQVVLNDAFFNKLACSRSNFVKIISRRLKKLRNSIK